MYLLICLVPAILLCRSGQINTVLYCTVLLGLPLHHHSQVYNHPQVDGFTSGKKWWCILVMTYEIKRCTPANSEGTCVNYQRNKQQRTSPALHCTKPRGLRSSSREVCLDSLQKGRQAHKFKAHVVMHSTVPLQDKNPITMAMQLDRNRLSQ